MKSSKVTQFRFVILLIVLFLTTILTRFYALTNKPIHFDESINGWFVMEMKNGGFYKYDPNNYHGPLYFYILKFFEFLGGRSLETLRTVPAFFSVLSVMVFALPILKSRPVTRWMCFFLLLSPAFVFYGRSGIHEMPFVFFQLLAALGVLRWLERQDGKALGLLLTGLFGMMMLKETFAIMLFSGVVAFLSLGLRELRTQLSLSKLKAAWSRSLTWLTILLVFIFVQVFTGGLRNISGLIDFVKAFLPWLKTGMHGKGHDKAFTYWLEVLWKAEPLVLLGAVLALAGLFSKRRELRFVSVFSLTQLLIYSAVPYKTVWCILSIVWGFYFVLAYTLEGLKSKKKKIGLSAAVGILTIFSLHSLYKSVYQKPLDLKHPYIYVNSNYQLEALKDLFIQTAQKNPEVLKMPIQIGMVEQWPWPWLLSSFQISSYQLCGKTIFPGAIVYFCDPVDMLLMDRTVEKEYWKIRISFRQDRGDSFVYLSKEIFPEVPFKDVELVGGDQE